MLDFNGFKRKNLSLSQIILVKEFSFQREGIKEYVSLNFLFKETIFLRKYEIVKFSHNERNFLRDSTRKSIVFLNSNLSEKKLFESC